MEPTTAQPPEVKIPGLGPTTVLPTGADGSGTDRFMSEPFVVSRPYLNFMIAGGDYEFATGLNLIIDGRVVRTATGLSMDRLRPVSFDLSRWIGQTAQVEVVADGSVDRGWIRVESVVLSSRPSVDLREQPLYHEALRPQLHFTARQWAMSRLNPVERQEGWLNDLNGLVHFDGEYHLFAQRWNKCWLHAVSTDLVHWTELAPAFFEESLGTGVQSGSCVVDHDNSSGLGSAGTPPMVAFWSRNDNRSQCVSYSQDRGRTWQHYSGNPIMDLPERDPMVLRDHRGSQWIMVLYGGQRYHLLRSDDLLHWEKLDSVIEDSFECPDFFELPVVGTDTTRWVLVRGDGRYSIGTFDGLSFSEETPQLQIDGGPHFYATQSWGIGNGIAPRRVQVAWMRGGSYPNMPFNQQVSLPCELTLHRTDSGLRLKRTPVVELDSLVRARQTWPGRTIAAGESWRIGAATPQLRLTFDLELAAGATAVVRLFGIPIMLTATDVELLGARQPTLSALTQVDMIIDATSIEVFANHGEASLTGCVHAGPAELTISAEGGPCVVGPLEVADLASIWSL